MISLAIQGGAMRSIYCFGAVRAVIDAGYAPKVRTIHVASAGCVSGALFASHLMDPKANLRDVAAELLKRLGGDAFINPKRLRKIVDVDLLVNSIRDVIRLSPRALERHSLAFEVALTDFEAGVAHYIDVAKSVSDDDLYNALRATMAIPLLYPEKVVIGGRRYVDGGVTDPLPVLRALQHGPQAVIAISSVALGHLGQELEGRESNLARVLPGLSGPVRHLLLSRNPLGAAVECLTQLREVGGIRMVRIAPLDQRQMGHRLETDPEKLLRLEALGYEDGLRALDAAGDLVEEAAEPLLPG